MRCTCKVHIVRYVLIKFVSLKSVFMVFFVNSYFFQFSTIKMKHFENSQKNLNVLLEDMVRFGLFVPTVKINFSNSTQSATK